jgi:hypothetical protein
MQPLNAPAPNGANVTAYYHTHGAYDPKYDSEIFSDTYDGRGDIPFAKSHEMDVSSFLFFYFCQKKNLYKQH